MGEMAEGGVKWRRVTWLCTARSSSFFSAVFPSLLWNNFFWDTQYFPIAFGKTDQCVENGRSLYLFINAIRFIKKVPAS